MSEEIKAVYDSVTENIHEELLRSAYGWGDLVGLALVDAVFSIRAKYEAKDESKGVLGRLKALRAEYEQNLSSLTSTAQIGEGILSEIMGHGETGGRSKSSAVLEAASKLAEAGLDTRELISRDPEQTAAIYRTVDGLGPVTAEYFLMLLGVPGVKADVQITAFVNEALQVAGLPTVNSKTAGKILKEVHALHFSEHQVFADLRLFDNAVWRYQSSK